MDASAGRTARLAEAVHHYLLWLLVGSYALAAVLPQPGLWLRSVDLGGLAPGGWLHVPLPAALLGFLLFSAGLGVQPRRLWQLARRPTLLAAGVAANLVLPVAFILGTATTMRLWHNPREVQEILVGLALIASMPVAGSSTAWAQNADGDLALSIGLVVCSTCLSPFTTPLVLHAVGWMADGEYAAALHALAAGEVSGFLAAFVLLPSLLGTGARLALGEGPFGRLRPALKLAGSAVLLALCYANAAVALPQTVAQPDWDFLAVMLVIVLAMCAAGFAAGAGLGWAFRADRARRAALMFGLGMTNNGTGLVVAAAALSRYPAVMVPIIFYNLVQHVVAAVADHFWLGAAGDGPPAGPPPTP
ncbi:bile acid:sodium symporter [Gemmata sp. JC717]|uniref:bile acid:sodium symporter family protein n=1 Tax=Gemmata algarum TaxID=2975278 RepID=UPI0021BB0CE3|nr:bile acid:sodium symporter [Gemmata algarum]MDY3557080.1 bile acid:sodium symporter [Gemmata algarum]